MNVPRNPHSSKLRPRKFNCEQRAWLGGMIDGCMIRTEGYLRIKLLLKAGWIRIGFSGRSMGIL